MYPDLSVEFESNGLMTVGRVPSSLFSSSYLLVAVLYSRDIYHSVRPASLRTITPVLSLNLNLDGVHVSVKDLSQPILMAFQFNLNITQVNGIVEDVFIRHTRTNNK